MREGHAISGQQIKHSRQRRNRQKLGKYRRVVNTEFSNSGMADKFFVLIAFGINHQAAALMSS